MFVEVQLTSTDAQWAEGVFCGTRNAESCQRVSVICRKFNADFFSRMVVKYGTKVQNVTEMNICQIFAVN